MAPNPSLAELAVALADRYRIERELGAGGMATVYLARDLARDRNVALKVLRPELAAVSGAERFEREIRVAARLVHPHILPLLDSGAAAGQLWYTMPLVVGESLRDRLDRDRQLPLEEAIRLTGEIADGLALAHRQGILHRDIKPENVLLVEGHALIADFGIARAIGDDGDRLTGTGFALGTPGYMSPEQSSGQHQLDARSDLYALASVCYEMLAGEPPFTGPTAQAVIAKRMSLAAPSVRTLRPAVPGAVDSVIRRALAAVPADRHGTIAEFAAALAAAARGGTAPRTRWPVFGAVAGLIGIAAVALWLWQSRGPTAPSIGNPADHAVRLAVLPFRLIGADTGDRYLAEGLTEEVTSALANLGGLRVIDRAAAASSARRDGTARRIGTALGVEALVEGVLQKSGDALRVRVRLIDPATEEERWNQVWDHGSGDVFRIQSEVATRVAAVLRIQLAERESRTLARPPTTNPEAYDAFLRARATSRVQSVRNRREPIDSVIAELRRAVGLDSTFATAWGMLASELVSTVFLFDADSLRLQEADRAIATALRLDSTVAIAWKARHDLRWNAVRGWHFAEALADVRRALALRPSLVDGHNALGSLLFHYGFPAEAQRSLESSVALDPSDGCDDPTRCTGFSRPRIARVLWYQQRFDSALAVYRRIPHIGGFVWEQAVVLGALGRAEDGLRLLDSVGVASPQDNGDLQAVRGLLHAMLGHREAALKHLAAGSARPTGRSHFHHAQFTIACAYARLGMKREAVKWLRQAADNGMPNHPLFRDDPNLATLHGDPGYEALMARLEGEHQSYRRLIEGSR